MRRGGGLKKRFFVHGFGPQFVLKIRGGNSGPPGFSPGSATVSLSYSGLHSTSFPGSLIFPPKRERRVAVQSQTRRSLLSRLGGKMRDPGNEMRDPGNEVELHSTEPSVSYLPRFSWSCV